MISGQLVIESEYASGGTLTKWISGRGERAPTVESALSMTSGISNRRSRKPLDSGRRSLRCLPFSNGGDAVMRGNGPRADHPQVHSLGKVRFARRVDRAAGHTQDRITPGQVFVVVLEPGLTRLGPDELPGQREVRNQGREPCSEQLIDDADHGMSVRYWMIVGVSAAMSISGAGATDTLWPALHPSRHPVS